MPAPKNPLDAINRVGQWASDTLGLSGAKPVDPYQFDWTNANQTRAGEMSLLGQYQQMAAGNGPSLAQGQLQQATDQNIRQAMALGAAQQGQGLGYASALRGIADQSAQARQQAAAQSALIRNQEQMQAMGAQGALYGQIGAQDYQQQGMGAQNAQYYGGLNANIDAQNAAGRRQFFGGVANAAGSLGGMMLGGMAHGGVVPGYASGGPVVDPKMRAFADYLRTNYHSGPDKPITPQAEGPHDTSSEAYRTHMFLRSAPKHLSDGGAVPGYAHGGDSSRNDTVPAMLSPGEIVIPRSITMAPNAGELSKMFVEMVQQRRERPSPSEEHPVVRDALKKRKAA